MPCLQPDKHKIVGYLLGKMDDEHVEDLGALLEDAEGGPVFGHVTSLAVLRSHRKLGVSTRSSSLYST